MTDKLKKKNAADSPIVWFCVLERARQDDNFELAAIAKQELKRLGVIVKYHKAKSDGGIYAN